MRTTQASQLWQVQIYEMHGWERIGPLHITQACAEHAMAKYAPFFGKLAIRTAPFTHREELK